MKKLLLFISIAVIVFPSCSTKQNKLKQISSLKKDLFYKSVKTFDNRKADQLVDLYIRFVNEYPKDTNAANFLFDAANISEATNPKYAVDLLNRVIVEYPESKRVPDCMFYKGFTYDEKLKDFKKAKECYEEYLQKFPNHTWAKDIPDLIKMLGKTPEQIGAELAAKQHSDSLAAKK